METKELPFAKEFITDTKGYIIKIIMDFNDYRQFLDWIEDEGLARAMNGKKMLSLPFVEVGRTLYHIP